MVQAQLSGTFDGVVVFPLLRGAVAAWREEAMQHGEEDGSLDGKLETAAVQQIVQDLADRTSLPQTLEDQGRADPSASSGDGLTASLSAEDGELFRESSEGLDESVQFTASQKFIEAPEAEQDALFDLAVDPFVIDDE